MDGASQEMNFEDIPPSYFDDVAMELTVQEGFEEILVSEFENQPTGNNHPPLPPYCGLAKPKEEYVEPEELLSDLTVADEHQSVPTVSSAVSAASMPLRIESVRSLPGFHLRTTSSSCVVSTNALGKLPITVTGAGGAKYVALPIRSSSELKGLNGASFSSGARPLGENVYSVPLNTAPGGKVLQKITMSPRSVSIANLPPGVTCVRVATASQLASARGNVFVSSAPYATAFRSAGPFIAMKNMPSQAVNSANVQALLRNAVPVATSGDSATESDADRPGLERLPPSLRKGPIVLSAIPGTSTLQPIELPAHASSLLHSRNTVQRFIQIGGKLTPVQVIEDPNLARQLSLIRVRAEPRPQPPPASPPRYPVAAGTALMDHNFASSAPPPKQPAQGKKIPVPKVKPVEVPRWNRSELNVGDFLSSEMSNMRELPLDELLPPDTSKPDKKEPKEPPPKGKKTCNCTKSQCLKLYCECFSSGEFCIGCNCLNCHNDIEHEDERQRAVARTLERNPTAFMPKIGPSVAGAAVDGKRHNRGCNCKKSYCLKNYCECFEAKILCTHLCRCLGCKNQGDETSRQVLISLCDAADQEAKFRRQSRLLARFAGARPDGDDELSGDDGLPTAREPERYEHALPPETFSFHHSPDMDGVWDYFRGEVIEATCLCLLGKGKEAVDQGLSDEQVERAIIDECKRCLDQIVTHAQSEQPRFLDMKRAAEVAAVRLKHSVASFEEQQVEELEKEVGTDTVEVNGEEATTDEPPVPVSPPPAKRARTRGGLARRALM